MGIRKAIAVLLIAAFVELTTSCTSTIRRAPEQLRPGKKVYRIVRVQKKSGETINFGKGTVAQIRDGEIRPSGVIKLKPGEFTNGKEDGRDVVKTADGRTYPADRAVTKGRHFLLRTGPDLAIPLSEISAVWTKHARIVASVALVAGCILAAFAAGLGLYLLITGKTLMSPMPFGFLGGARGMTPNNP